MRDFWNYYEHLVRASEVRAKVDPRTMWYLPRAEDGIEQFFAEKDEYLYIDARTIPFNKCKELIESSNKKKVAIHTYFDRTGSMMLANYARLGGYKVVIEFLEHAMELTDAA